MKLGLLGAIVVTLIVTQPVNEPLTKSAVANEWLEAAETHEPGKFDAPLQKIASWDAERLERTLNAIRETRPSERLNDLIERGALLHADITLQSRNAREPTRVKGWVSPTLTRLVNDGTVAGVSPLDAHAHFGRAFLRAVRPPFGDTRAMRQRIRDWTAARERDPRLRQWFRALSAHFAARHSLADQRPHFEDARQLIPSDPGLLFDAGCFGEVIASAQVQNALPPSLPSSKRNTLQLRVESDALLLDERFNLAEAERQYRQLLEREPGHAEARVRLARVLTLRGRPEDALTLLESSIDSMDAVVRYYGALALGQAAEATQKPDLARDAYEQATSLFPRAQSPLFARLRLARMHADDAGARQTARAIALLRGTEGDRPDPWWDYFDCNGRNRDREVAQLRRLFTTEAAR